jgi:hypothetical protein
MTNTNTNTNTIQFKTWMVSIDWGMGPEYVESRTCNSQEEAMYIASLNEGATVKVAEMPLVSLGMVIQLDDHTDYLEVVWWGDIDTPQNTINAYLYGVEYHELFFVVSGLEAHEGMSEWHEEERLKDKVSRYKKPRNSFW